MKRLCSVRDVLDLLDFADESIGPLRTHLLRAASHPRFLKCAEGRRFVAHLFRADAGFAADLHRAARAQIAGARKSVLAAYADIYYHAWKGAAERAEEVGDDDDDDDGRGAAAAAIRASLEENALQDLAYLRLHAAVPAASAAARAVLGRFHDHKKAPDVERLLHRTYGPLLWRALAAAHAGVRARAADVLADTFPLRDPDAGPEQTEACAARGVAALRRAMEDDVPRVRAAGSRATAKVLSLFWSAVPPKDIRSLLNRECLNVDVFDAPFQNHLEGSPWQLVFVVV